MSGQTEKITNEEKIKEMLHDAYLTLTKGKSSSLWITMIIMFVILVFVLFF